MNVLIIEDEYDIVHLYKMCLELEGHSVDIMVENFNDIFVSGAIDGYDVVIVDLMLPGLNGADVVSFIKGYNPEVRIVVVTAALNLIDEALLTSADMVLSKPFRPLDLVVAVEGTNLTESNGATVLRRTMHRYIWEGNRDGSKAGKRVS